MKHYEKKINDGRAPPVDERVLLILAMQLLGAVSHLHKHRIVHRDIKADNVMIRERESEGNIEFVLIDFGCALDCQRYELDEFNMPYPVPMSKGGAPGYLAPEVGTYTLAPSCTAYFARGR